MSLGDGEGEASGVASSVGGSARLVPAARVEGAGVGVGLHQRRCPRLLVQWATHQLFPVPESDPGGLEPVADIGNDERKGEKSPILENFKGPWKVILRSQEPKVFGMIEIAYSLGK